MNEVEAAVKRLKVATVNYAIMRAYNFAHNWRSSA